MGLRKKNFVDLKVTIELFVTHLTPRARLRILEILRWPGRTPRLQPGEPENNSDTTQINARDCGLSERNRFFVTAVRAKLLQAPSCPRKSASDAIWRHAAKTIPTVGKVRFCTTQL